MAAFVPPPPPAKPVIKRDGFTVKDGRILNNGHERVDGPRLEAMFHPERQDLQRDQKKASDEARRLFSRPFFAAQLRFYGITFPRSATEAQLKSLLDKAVAAKQCVNVPAPIIRLHRELKLDYDKELEAWQKTVGSWDAEWKRRHEEEWAQLETPSERAGHDLDRFMDHYFLTGGQPDPDKKPEPLALYGFTDDQVITEIHERAARVPGLVITSGGQGADRTICMGWDRAAVCGMAGEIENIARERQRQLVQAEWEKAMQNHQQHVEATRVEATRVEATRVEATRVEAARLDETPQPESISAADLEAMPLKAARGSFALQCKAVTDRYPDQPNMGSFTLDITDSPANNGDTLRAAIEFGIFQATAILSFSPPVLEWFSKHYDTMATSRDGKSSASASRKGKRKGKRKAKDHIVDERPSKQRKPDEPPQAGRVFIRARGRILTGGNICAEIQHGYLDFADSAYNKFTGVFDIPGIGEDVPVEGYRVAKNALIEPLPWNWFCPGAQ